MSSYWRLLGRGTCLLRIMRSVVLLCKGGDAHHSILFQRRDTRNEIKHRLRKENPSPVLVKFDARRDADGWTHSHSATRHCSSCSAITFTITHTTLLLLLLNDMHRRTQRTLVVTSSGVLCPLAVISLVSLKTKMVDIWCDLFYNRCSLIFKRLESCSYEMAYIVAVIVVCIQLPT